MKQIVSSKLKNEKPAFRTDSSLDKKYKDLTASPDKKKKAIADLLEFNFSAFTKVKGV